LNVVVQYLRVIITRMRMITYLNSSILVLFGFVIAMLAYNFIGIFAIAPSAYVLFGLGAGILLQLVLGEKDQTMVSADGSSVLQYRRVQPAAREVRL